MPYNLYRYVFFYVVDEKILPIINAFPYNRTQDFKWELLDHKGDRVSKSAGPIGPAKKKFWMQKLKRLVRPCDPEVLKYISAYQSSPISESAGALMLLVRCILQMQAYFLSGCAIFLVHKLLYSTTDNSLSMRKYIKDNIYIFFRNAFVFSLLIMYAVIVYVNF